MTENAKEIISNYHKFRMNPSEKLEWNCWNHAALVDLDPDEYGGEIDRLHWEAVEEIEIREYLREDGDRDD